MKVTQTDLKGFLIIEPDIFADDRGYFFESYNQKKYEENGIPEIFIQDNQSRSKQNVIRGLHYQIEEMLRENWCELCPGRFWV